MKNTHLVALLILLFAGINVYAQMDEPDSDVMKSDANHDGKVSFEEYKAAHEADMMARFKHRDINNDGFIDLEEKAVAIEKQQVQHAVEKEVETQQLREQYEEDRKKRKKHFFKYQ